MPNDIKKVETVPVLRLESFSVFAWMDQVDIVTLTRAQIGSNADLEAKNIPLHCCKIKMKGLL